MGDGLIVGNKLNILSSSTVCLAADVTNNEAAPIRCLLASCSRVTALSRVGEDGRRIYDTVIVPDAIVERPEIPPMLITTAMSLRLPLNLAERQNDSRGFSFRLSTCVTRGARCANLGPR